MRARRYEILLPTRYDDGRWVSDEKLHQVRDELVEMLGTKATPPRLLLLGHVYTGPRFEGKAVQLILEVEDSPTSHEFFVRYKQTLSKRFEQTDIYIVSYSVDIL